MPRDFRFGRRVAMPSTVQIKRELRIMIAANAEADAARIAEAAGVAPTVADLLPDPASLLAHGPT